MAMRKVFKYSYGVDIGGTNTNIALVDRDGNIIDSDRVSTRLYHKVEDFVSVIAKVIAEMTERHKVQGRVCGIGVGAPAVNVKTRCIECASDLPWHDNIPFARMLGSATGLPVSINNDANAAAVGEMMYGAARGMSDFIVLTLGTGVGSGIVCDGHLIEGKNGFAGELGHVAFGWNDDRKCSCGRRGCLQTMCSSGGLVLTARKIMESTLIPSVLRGMNDDELTARAIGEAASAGDNIARQTINIAEEALGRACAEFAAFTDPEAIILFGGVARPEVWNLGHIIDVMNNNILFLYRNKIKLLFSGLQGADAALLGAASLPWQNRQL